MQRTNILNLDIKQSKLYGFFKNAVLLLLFLFFSIFGKSFVQFGSLFKEVFARMAAEEMMCVLQFALNELGRFYFAVKAAVAALALCTGIFNACRAIFASVRRGRGLGVRFVARRAVASVDARLFFAHPFIRSVSDIKNSFSPRFRRGKFQSDFFYRCCRHAARFCSRGFPQSALRGRSDFFVPSFKAAGKNRLTKFKRNIVKLRRLIVI